MIQALNINSSLPANHIYRSKTVSSGQKPVTRYNLKADTVSFSSLALLRKPTMIEKAMKLINPGPTPGEIAARSLKFASQVASVISSIIALMLLL
jgi:hypothetical protein